MAEKKENTNGKTPTGTAEEAAAGWTKNVVEHFMDAQKRWLELATEQNALAMKAVQQGLEFYKAAPSPALADWVKHGIQTFLDTQRQMAEAAAKQNAQFADAMRAGGTGTTTTPMAEATEAAEATADYTRKALDGFIDMQKQWLDFVAQQNVQYVNSIRKVFGYDDTSPGADLETWAHNAAESYATMQKRWIEMLTQIPFPWASVKK